MKKVFVVMCVVAVSLLLSSQVALAGKTFFANVKADAICTVIDTDVMVDAGLIQTDTPSSGPSCIVTGIGPAHQLRGLGCRYRVK